MEEMLTQKEGKNVKCKGKKNEVKKREARRKDELKQEKVAGSKEVDLEKCHRNMKNIQIL